MKSRLRAIWNIIRSKGFYILTADDTGAVTRWTAGLTVDQAQIMGQDLIDLMKTAHEEDEAIRTAYQIINERG